MRYAEWDWPPRRRRFRTVVVGHQPGGWNSPGAKKAVRIYWRATVVIIKMLLAIPLSVMTIAALWLLWVIVTLPWR